MKRLIAALVAISALIPVLVLSGALSSAGGRVTSAHGSVIGIDESASMVQAARGRLGPDVDLRVMDLLELELEEPVDAILSTATFHWIADHEEIPTMLSLTNSLRARSRRGRNRCVPALETLESRWCPSGVSFDPAPGSPAAQVCDRHIQAPIDDEKASLELARSSDLVTFEWELIQLS